MFSRLSERVAMARLACGVRQANLAYLSPAKLAALEEALDDDERNNVPGDFLEFGAALGGSAILIAARLGNGRAFHGYDVFGMIPSPGERDDARSHERYAEIRGGRSHGIGGETYYGYVVDLYARVSDSFAKTSRSSGGKLTSASDPARYRLSRIPHIFSGAPRYKVAKRFARAKQPRHDCSDRDREPPADLVVAQAIDRDEQDDFSLLVR